MATALNAGMPVDGERLAVHPSVPGMIGSIFNVDKQVNNLLFNLLSTDCEKMGWGN